MNILGLCELHVPLRGEMAVVMASQAPFVFLLQLLQLLVPEVLEHAELVDRKCSGMRQSIREMSSSLAGPGGES